MRVNPMLSAPRAANGQLVFQFKLKYSIYVEILKMQQRSSQFNSKSRSYILFTLSLFLSFSKPLFVKVVFPSHIVFLTLRWPDLSLSISLWRTEVDVPCLNLFRERQQFITANPLVLWVCTFQCFLAFIRWSVALRMHLFLQFIEEQ